MRVPGHAAAPPSPHTRASLLQLSQEREGWATARDAAAAEVDHLRGELSQAARHIDSLVDELEATRRANEEMAAALQEGEVEREAFSQWAT